jgi:hypothetical protein
MTDKDVKQVSELEQSLKALANLTNNKRLYDQVVLLLQQMWMGNQYGLRNIHQFMDLAEFNWIKNRKVQAQKKGLRIVK